MLNYPKIELHCHLDGSLRPETVMELANENNLQIGSSDIGLITDQLIAPQDCDSLVTYLERFSIPNIVLQTEEALKRAAYELMEDAAEENVKYIEIRFAPQKHLLEGLTLEQVIGSVVEGIHDAESRLEIKGNLILSYLRHTDVSGMFDMINAGAKYLHKGVVAVDLCSAELEGFAEDFIPPVTYARELGYKVTIHAGETGFSSNVIDSVQKLKADRIGHGVAIMNDPIAFDTILKHHITIEACPTSNLQTKAILNMADHPIDTFMERGLITTVNTDNRTVSDTTMTKEYQLLETHFGWNENHFKQVYMNSIEASFADDATKNWLSQF